MQSVEDERKQAENYKAEVGVALANVIYICRLPVYTSHTQFYLIQIF